MASGFAPEFLILVGVDIFLGASILTVLLDRHFPTALPYVLDLGAMVGFGQLLSGPSFVSNLSAELQFYYSFAYAMISVLTLFALNLYLLFLRRRPFESAMLGVFATVPSALGVLYFTSAFVNGLAVSLPLLPVIPIEGVYILFGVSVGLIVLSLVVFGKKLGGRGEPWELERVPTVTGPIPARANPGDKPPADPPSTTPAVVSATTPPERILPVQQAEPRVGDVKAGLKAAGNPSGSTVTVLEAPPVKPLPSLGAVPAAAPRAEAPFASDPASSDRDYSRRLAESVRFFEAAVDAPIQFDVHAVGDNFKGVAKAFLAPGGVVLLEDSKGKRTSVPLSDFSTDEALRIMREASKGLAGVGGPIG